jgi:hypothetical protein
VDEHLRELQRYAEADLAARSQLLRARLRRGELNPERVALAAYLGDEAATACAAAKPAPGPLLEWVTGLARWGPEALLRAGVAAARSALEAWADYAPDDERLSQALGVVERWLLDPAAVPLADLIDAEESTEAAAQEALRWGTKTSTVAHDAAMAVAYVFQAITTGDPDAEGHALGADAPELVRWTASAAADALGREGAHFVEAKRTTGLLALLAAQSAQREAGKEGARRLRPRIALELLPWALGLDDPVSGPRR